MVDEVQTYLCPGLPGKYVQIEDYQALQAHLAKAREALESITGVGFDAPMTWSGTDSDWERRRANTMQHYARETLALIDTPAPAPSPDDLVRAALEWAATAAQKKHEEAMEWAKKIRGLEKHVGKTDSLRIAEEIRAAAVDPATVAAIIERAGK
jgi:hypothetical protein